MNSLYGYPMVGPAALGGMSGVVDETELVWSVLRGESAKELETAKKTMKANRAELDAQRAALARLGSGASRSRAASLYQEATRLQSEAEAALRSAVQAHNSVAKAIRDYSAGMFSPSDVGMSSLALAPVVAGGAVVAAVLVASAFALSTFTEAWSVFVNKAPAAKGYIQQTGEALKEAGGTFMSFGSAAMKTAFAVVLVLGAVAGYQFFRARSKGGAGGGVEKIT